MSRTRSCTLALITVAMTMNLAAAQTPAPPSGQQSLASAIHVYVFPNDGQKFDQQSKDEGECYKWAVRNTGTDPFETAKQAQQQTAQQEQQAQAAKASGSNAGAKGTVIGGAGGAVIGAIAGDTGKGAAIGAGVGLITGRAKKRQTEEQAKTHEQQAAQAQQIAKEQTDNFKTAFGTCLEAKKYLVNY